MNVHRRTKTVLTREREDSNPYFLRKAARPRYVIKDDIMEGKGKEYRANNKKNQNA